MKFGHFLGRKQLLQGYLWVIWPRIRPPGSSGTLSYPSPTPSTPSRQHKVQLPNVVFANMYGVFDALYLSSGSPVVKYRIVNPRYVCSSLLNF